MINNQFSKLNLLSGILFLSLISSFSPLSAERVYVSGLLLDLNKSTLEASVMGSSISDGEGLEIPSHIIFDEEDYVVTEIGNGAFQNRYNVRGPLNLPETIRIIGNSAFSNCTGFTGSLTIPVNVISIGDAAFSNCTGFSGTLNIPESVTSIGDAAFSNCSGFSGSLIIPESVTEIGDYAFTDCTGFTGSLKLPNGMSSIGNAVFSRCIGFTGILEIPKDVTIIGARAFNECSGFSGNLAIPEGVRNIGWGAFANCSGFSGSLIIPEGITEIETGVFEGCTGFSGTLVLPEGVTHIRDKAFFNCSGLTGSLVIPESVYEIGSNAFGGCRSLTGSLKLPESVFIIGTSAFEGCNGFSETLSIYCNHVGSAAFKDCNRFSTIDLKEGKVFTSIEDGTFSGCSRLSGSLEIPNNINGIGENAFSGCSAFLELKLPSSCGIIGERAFENCEFKRIESLSLTPPTTSSSFYCFSNREFNMYMSTILEVPSESIESYRTATEWKKFEHIKGLGEVEVEGLRLDKTSLSLNVGDTEKLTAIITPDGAVDKTVTWSSSESTIATVCDGTITALAPGKVIISAETANGLSATCEVTVIQPAQSISIDFAASNIKGDDINLYIGESKELKIKFTPENTTNKTLTWTTSDASKVSVDEMGKITALSLGDAIITATAASGVKTSLNVRVLPTLASSIQLNLPEATLKVSESVALSATIHPETTTDKSLTWTSSDEKVAVVDENGKVTAISIGETTITVKAVSGVEATCKITVVETPASSIELNLPDATLKVSESVELIATVLPETTSDKTLTWTSSDESVATVDENGKVTAIAVGEATITVKTENRVEATCKITVIETPASSIELNLPDATLKVSESVELIATVLPETTSDKTLTWTSSDESVAMVDENGKVTAISIGETTITVKAVSGVEATCKITVVETPASSIELNLPDATLKVSESVELMAKVLPETATDKTLTWTSSDESVATVDENGKVTAIGVGEAIITVRASSGVYAECKVTVIGISVERITIIPNLATMEIDETLALQVQVSPADATDKSVSWSSSDESIATVDSKGVVHAIKAGTATITATSENGISGTAEILVMRRQLPDVTIIRSADHVDILDQQTTTLYVEAEGGYPDGFKYEWLHDGQTVGSDPILNVIGECKDNKETIENYSLRVTNSHDGDVIFDETFDFVLYVYPLPAENIYAEVSALKVRAGSAVTLSGLEPTGGNSDGWSYEWYCNDQLISTSIDGEVTMEMHSGIDKSIQTNTFRLKGINRSPNGEIWAEVLSEDVAVSVYCSPEIPVRLTRKGDGHSRVIIAMFAIDNKTLEEQGYRYVFGYTSPDGEEHTVEKTDKRYCRYDDTVFANANCRKWCYAEWIYADGSIVTSGKVYLDGEIDTEFDASVFDGNISNARPSNGDAKDWIQAENGGARIEVTAASDTRITVYTVNGELVMADHVSAGNYKSMVLNSGTLRKGIYIIHVNSKDGESIKKVNIL